MPIRPSATKLAIVTCWLGALPFAASADQWQDIQQRKELRCGTFADVPPFAAPDPKTREMVLASWHPRQSVEAVRAATGWDLRVAAGCRETSTPTSAELETVRACDPAGFWTR